MKMLILALVVSFVFVISSAYVISENEDLGSQNGSFVSSIFAFPKKISKYFTSDKEVIQYSTIPKEVLVVYEDLENRLNDESVDALIKTEEWKLEKAKETSMKFHVSVNKVMELYVKVKDAK